MAGISVLVIESHSQFRQLLARFLLETDADDLLVCGAVAHIRDLLPLTCGTQPQIVLLGLSGDVQAALAAGADRFLDKFAVSTRLIPAIRQLACFDSGAGYA